MLHENSSATNEFGHEVNGEEKDESDNKLSSNLKNNLQVNLKSFQMPANLTASEFGEVNILRSQPSANAVY